MTYRRFWVAIALCLSVLFGGCSVSPIGSSAVGDANSPIVTQAGAPQDQGLRFQSGDKIKVVVFGEDSLTGEYEVDTNGFITLPLAGSINAKGLNKAELEQAIARELKKRGDVLHPRVTVEATEFRPFYVLGEVNKPGAYPYQSG
jgi:protein involved in polysaccharide export with SLBB domain